MTKAIWFPSIGAISTPPSLSLQTLLAATVRGVKRRSAWSLRGAERRGPACSSMLRRTVASLLLSARCILFPGKPAPPACVRTATYGTFSYLAFAPLRGSRGSRGGVGGGGCFPTTAGSLFSTAVKFGIFTQAPRSKLGRICSRRLRCSAAIF